MVRIQLHVITFFRQNSRTRQNPISTQIRYLTLESKDTDFSSENPIKDLNQEPISLNAHQNYVDIVKQVCDVTRTRPRWEQTLISDFRNLNFADPLFFQELLKKQTNVFLSFRFFHWLRSHFDFSPDQVSCNVLFDALVEAKALKAAKSVLDFTGFTLETVSLESYVKCLCESGNLDETVEVFSKFKEFGVSPSIGTWNSALILCLKTRRTNLFWEFYQEMAESGMTVDSNVETAEYLILAFCIDGDAEKGYDLLIKVLESGQRPGYLVFGKLISGFCKLQNFEKVSEILHMMILINRPPNLLIYQEVINGFCKYGKTLEGFRVFTDLKDRGYNPDIVMYTTVIQGLCKLGSILEARNLWCELINKGLVPDGITYTALINGYFKSGDLEEVEKLYKEMCEKGYGETQLSYNTMIVGFSLCNKMDKAFELFKEMVEKGVVPKVFSYKILVRGFCKKGESTDLLKKLVAEGL